jgi:hypothetical protein
MEAVLAFLPDEQRVQYSAMTGQSLFYMGETDLKHKVLAIVEEEGAHSASYALKLLQSEGVLTIASTGKDPNSGRHITHQYRVEGPVMIFLTTTAIQLDEELLNRCMVLSVNEEREQTQAIHRVQREAQTLEGLLRRRDRDAILSVHRNGQRLLKPMAVVNPYARELTFNDGQTRTRRDHTKYLTLIRSIALLHQYQRPRKTTDHRGHLSLSQRNAVDTVLTSRDQMMALEGVAGAGKTTSLAAVREAAVRAGYEVEGLAPTSRAAQKLGEAGMATETLQRHLTRGDRADDGQKRLYVVDESSMASTKQMHTFVERLKENDRVLFVGDTRQHEAVEAGRPYAQLQEAGLRTAHLDEIIRQKDPALKEAVEQLARGEVRDAIGNLNQQGRVHEIGDRHERIAEIAREYVRSPESTLVVSPDNESRREINSHIHRAMQDSGQVKGEEHQVAVLYARQDITGADRQHAQNYEQGDVIRYSKGSKPLGIEAGEYAQVVRTDAKENMVTVERKSGEELSYDPRRLQGVTVYRETERTFAEGDRVQMTAPYHEQKLANRELGTVDKIDGDGNLKLKMDSGREVEFNAKQHPHLDYGYAVTSHSSQGQTADRVLIHVDSSQAHGELLNSRMAYVSVSRAQFDVQMYTNDAKMLGQQLSRDVSNPSAIQQTSDPSTMQQQTPIQQEAGLKIEPQSVGMELSQGLSMGR